MSIGLLVIIALALACTKEVVKEVTVPGETVIVEKEVIKEVPGETVVVEKEVIKEVTVEVMVEAPANPSVLAVTPPSFRWDGPTPTDFSEAPMLAELVKQGKLPPVEQRVPENPLVVRVGERIGEYGGTWRQIGACSSKLATPLFLHDQVTMLDLNEIDVIPNLAETVESSRDWKTWTIRLRKGLKWSDGEPFTSADFDFAVNAFARNTDLNPVQLRRLGNPGVGGYGKGGYVGELEVVDDFTFRYIFEDAEPGFLVDYSMTGWWGYSYTLWNASNATFMPAHYMKQFHPDYTDLATLEKMADDAGLDDWMQLLRSKGRLDNPDSPTMSPWIIVDDTPGAAAFERNPYYWAVDPQGNQLPYIDKVSMVCGESREAQDLKMLAGEVDFVHSANYIKFPLFAKQAAQGNYFSYSPETALTTNIDPNQDYELDMEIGDLMRTKDFRIALSLAIDKFEIRDTFFFGEGQPANISFMSNSPFYDDMEPYRNLYIVQDVERANELLDGLGYTKRDADGFRVRLDGKGRLEMTLTQVSEPSGGFQPDGLSELVIQHFAGVGLKFTLQYVPSSEWSRLLLLNEVQLWGPTGQQGGPVPPTPDMHWGPLMHAWAGSGGKDGRAPQTPELKRIFEIHKEAQRLPWADRGPLYSEAYRINNENQFQIGILAGSGIQNSYTVVKNNLKNVPLGPGNKALYVSRYGNGGYAPARPEQFFFEGGLNDAGF